MTAPVMPCDVLGYYYGEAMAGPFCMACHDAITEPGAGWPAEYSEDHHPIFRDSESDAPTHCALCESLIPHALTPDGIEYVREAVRSLRDGDGRAETVRQWRDRYLEGGAA